MNICYPVRVIMGPLAGANGVIEVIGDQLNGWPGCVLVRFDWGCDWCVFWVPVGYLEVIAS
jgi:hypothetical protein